MGRRVAPSNFGLLRAAKLIYITPRMRQGLSGVSRVFCLLLIAGFLLSANVLAQEEPYGIPPIYLGVPQEFLNQKAENDIRVSIPKEMFTKQVLQNPEFEASLTLAPWIRINRVLGLRVFREPQNPFWVKTGLKKNDIILALNGDDPNLLFAELKKNIPPYEILFLRDRKLQLLTLEVEGQGKQTSRPVPSQAGSQ